MRQILLIVMGVLIAVPAWSQSGTGNPLVNMITTGAQPAVTGAPSKLQPTGGEIVLDPTLDTTIPVQQRQLNGAGAKSKPFGWQLFDQTAPVARSSGINPDYVIETGDKISIQVWGAQKASDVVTVDLQGNIFLPEIGPIAVAGLRHRQLNDVVNRAFSKVYTSRVQVYINLLNTQPVGVYVTGAVVEPGRFAGDRSDSLLYFIEQAKGIDLKRGSFRDVHVIRNGKQIATADLYQFLFTGQLPHVQFQDNDTILVGPQLGMVTVSGSVRNAYDFEIGDQPMSGANVLTMAKPLPKSTHVAVRGIRGGEPFIAYVERKEFALLDVRKGDSLIFLSDMVEDTIFINVVGHKSGPSSFTVKRGTRMLDVLDIISIDPNVSDISAIYLRRKSVAMRQKQALELSLNHLQRSVLTAQSSSGSEAQIRVQEAQMVERFVNRARAVQPEGRVVMAGADLSNMKVEADDEIVIPQKSSLVIVSGEVLMPQTMVFRAGVSAKTYLSGAGGFTDRANTSNLILLRQSGEVITGSNPQVRPGDHIMVMPIADSKNMAIFKDMVDVLYRIAVSAGVIIQIL